MSWIWRRKETEKELRHERIAILDNLLEAVKLVSTQLSTHEKEIDMIKVRLKHRAFKDSDKDESEVVDEKKTDGFDSVREMRKNLNDQHIGI